MTKGRLFINFLRKKVIKIKAITDNEFFDEMLNRINNDNNDTYDYKQIINDLMDYITDKENKATEVR